MNTNLVRRIIKLLIGCVLLGAAVSCAHKAAPLTKDRLSPKLQSIFALNNRQVELIFSEDIDTINFQPANLTITADTETLKVLALYPSLSGSEIVAVTDLQEHRNYEVHGMVYDLAENYSRFTKSFVGSVKPDTMAPWLVAYSSGRGIYEFYLKFSEAMDTTDITFRIIPKKDFIGQWMNYLSCQIVPESVGDSLHFDTTYYLYIDRGVRDLSGNPLRPFVTTVTPDTVYNPLILRGAVLINDTLAKSGLAVLRRNITLGVALVEDGAFAFEVRDSLAYQVFVVSNEYTGQATLYAGIADTVYLRSDSYNIDSLFN